MRALLSLFAALALAAGAQAQANIVVEAEDAELFGNAAVATDVAGYSGSGYVVSLAEPGDSLRITVSTEAAFYQLRVASDFSGRFPPGFTVRVDGVEVEADGASGRGFAEALVAEFEVSAGSHTISVQTAASVDYLRLGTAPPPAVPPAALSDPDATAAARALYAFLLDEYGRHVLSAQQDIYSGTPRTFEIEYVTSTTGKAPAIGGFDLIEYSPTRVECGTGQADWPAEWIDWAQNGGENEAIVNLMWHWNAPTDLYDTDCNGADESGTDRQWYSGFYTRATSFDLAAALAEGPGGGRYDLLLRDIDAIAVQLQAFEDADVPVLWRPLHEAAGGFFWWGAQGPGALVELWQLMYDRLTDEHDLHNLIWVWTYEPTGDGSAPLDWYPGDDYVDVVGRDFYSEDPAALIRTEWDRIEATFSGRKLVALTETGTLPDMEDSADRGIWWSWFNVWNGFQRDEATVPAERLTRIYNSDVVLTRDELPDWRSYTLATSASGAPEAAPLGLGLFPNPTAGRATVRLTLDVAAKVTVEVYDLAGRLISREPLGAQSAGAVRAALALDVAAGTYLVRATVGDRVAHGTITVVR